MPIAFLEQPLGKKPKASPAGWLGWVGGGVGGWVGGWLGGWVGGWVAVGGWVGGWLGGWVGGWVGGWASLSSLAQPSLGALARPAPAQQPSCPGCGAGLAPQESCSRLFLWRVRSTPGLVFFQPCCLGKVLYDCPETPVFPTFFVPNDIS